jgi:hypothetical protein
MPRADLTQVWLAALLPPVAWMVDLLGGYFSIRFVNVHDRRWPLLVWHALALLLVFLGAALCWRAGRRLLGSRSTAAAVAGWGLALAAFFFLLILAQAYPALVLSAREAA